MSQLPPRVLFGAAYYHEYQPYPRLDTDLDLMAQAGFSVIRVGESVWSTWEPDNGRFQLEWLAPVLDGAQQRKISVILGTPTYAAPPWLARLYPEIAAERRSGQPMDWGARQEIDFTHPAFRFHAERVIRRIAERYADHPAVIGFQVDNEPGNELIHNHGVFQRFVDHLRQQYGDVETLNREWGLTYWSHRLATWADLWRPDGNAQPQYDLAWRRFQAQQTDEFISWQADIVREYARPEHFVTTCLAYDRPALHEARLAQRLDLTAGNPYYLMQDGLRLPDDGLADQGWFTGGTWALYQSADRIYSARQEPFLVTETNAGYIGACWDNRPAYDGQWRQAAWALVSRGARMIEYWHWHTLHFGAETHWGGILPHSGKPGRVYRELARLGAELRTAGELVAGLIPDADVAMLWSTPSKWLMEKYPALMAADGGPDQRAYQGLFGPFYQGAFAAGLQVRILHDCQLTPTGDQPGMDPSQVAAEHPVLVATGVYVAEDQTLDWLVAYAAAGGHLVLGPRTGYGDHEGRARWEVAPGRLREAAGVSYDEFSNLTTEVPVRASQPEDFPIPRGATATRWIDALEAEVARGTQVLAEYEHPHFGRWPAITTRAHGRGRVTTVGTVPQRDLAESLMRWLVPNPVSGWGRLPDTVRATTALAQDGRRVHVVHNWSWQPTEVNTPAGLPTGLTDVLSAQGLPDGGTVSLGAWDVRVLVEADHQDH